jgi:DNA-binding CsgD family transcriptional regulator
MKGKVLEMPEDKAGEPMIAGVLRRMAKERAESLKWNSQIAMMFYALLVMVALLWLRDANIFLIAALAAVGLLAVWVVSRVHWRRLEQRLYREELDNYHRIVSAEPETQIAQPEPWEEPLLTKRELEVLTMVADGRSNEQIALGLVISPQTVKNHISNILAKLGTTDRTSAALLAVSYGWIQSRPRPPSGRGIVPSPSEPPARPAKDRKGS